MKFLDRLKGFFVPQKENNYQARILHPSFLAGFVFLFLFNQTLINFFALLKPGVLGYSSDITPEKIVELTNNERVKKGLRPLKINSALNEAAQRKAGDMFAFDYWAHKSPSGREPWAFLKEVDYKYQVAGENLARDFSDADLAVKAWMNSPTHRENILNPKFREIGISVVEGTLSGINTTLVVQFFGTRSGAPVQIVAAQDIKSPAPLVLAEGEPPPLIISESIPAQQERVLISPLHLTKVFGTFLFGLIVAVLIVDGYFALKKKVYRATGRTTAHAVFLAVMFLLVLLNGGQGMIN